MNHMQTLIIVTKKGSFQSHVSPLFHKSFFYIFLCLFIFERGRDRAQVEEERQRERKIQNLKQAVSTEPDREFELKDSEIMTRAEVRHLTN